MAECIAFAMPHEQLGETVGLFLVVLQAGLPTLEDLRKFAADKSIISLKWLPECLVFADSIPKGATGKPARIGLAERFGLPALDANKTTNVTVWNVKAGKLFVPTMQVRLIPKKRFAHNHF